MADRAAPSAIDRSGARRHRLRCRRRNRRSIVLVATDTFPLVRFAREPAALRHRWRDAGIFGVEFSSPPPDPTGAQLVLSHAEQCPNQLERKVLVRYVRITFAHAESHLVELIDRVAHRLK